MLATRQFAARYDEFVKRGCEIVRIFRSPIEALQDHAAGPRAVPFPVLGDPEKRVYKRYGLRFSLLALFSTAARERIRQAREWNLKPRWRDALRDGIGGSPADFLVGPDGRLAQAHYGAHFADSITPAQALAWLDSTAAR